jgi:hypothetical protein
VLALRAAHQALVVALVVEINAPVASAGSNNGHTGRQDRM